MPATTSVLSFTPSFLATIVNLTMVRLQELGYFLTNMSPTVLGNHAHCQKRCHCHNWGRPLRFFNLLAQLGFDRIPTSTVKGIPSRRSRLRMDQRKFWWRFSWCGSIHCQSIIRCCTVWRPVHGGCDSISELCHLWYSFGGHLWEPPSSSTVTTSEYRPAECYGTGRRFQILKYLFRRVYCDLFTSKHIISTPLFIRITVPL